MFKINNTEMSNVIATRLEKEQLKKQRTKMHQLKLLAKQTQRLLHDQKTKAKQLKIIQENSNTEILKQHNYDQLIFEQNLYQKTMVDKFEDKYSLDSVNKILQLAADMTMGNNKRIKIETQFQKLLVEQKQTMYVKTSVMKNQIKIQEQIQKLSQKLHKRNRKSSIQNQIQQFIDQLKTNYQDQISNQDINLLQNLQFNTLALSIRNQIKQQDQRIKSDQLQINGLRYEYLAIEANMKEKNKIFEKLQNNEGLNHLLNQDLNQITQKVTHLQNNLDSQVQKIVDQRAQEMNNDNFSYVNKYLISTQFLIQKFAQILQKQELDEANKSIEKIKLQTNQRILQKP